MASKDYLATFGTNYEDIEMVNTQEEQETTEVSHVSSPNCFVTCFKSLMLRCKRERKFPKESLPDEKSRKFAVIFTKYKILVLHF